MRELRNIIKDIKSGALPLNEIPGFVWWLIGRQVWLALMAIVAFVLWARKK